MSLAAGAVPFPPAPAAPLMWLFPLNARLSDDDRDRHYILRQRTPAWADKAAIAAIYARARQITAETGTLHHVDHEVPLLGANVSGLHVEANLRIITATENIAKGNRFEPC